MFKYMSFMRSLNLEIFSMDIARWLQCLTHGEKTDFTEVILDPPKEYLELQQVMFEDMCQHARVRKLRVNPGIHAVHVVWATYATPLLYVPGVEDLLEKVETVQLVGCAPPMFLHKLSNICQKVEYLVSKCCFPKNSGFSSLIEGNKLVIFGHIYKFMTNDALARPQQTRISRAL
jgi:hypothetical protein